jgi:hypothetical protein
MIILDFAMDNGQTKQRKQKQDTRSYKKAKARYKKLQESKQQT